MSYKIKAAVLNKINNDLEKEVFLKTLENTIYSELNLID